MAAAVALVAVAVAGCGSGGSAPSAGGHPTDALEVINSAAQATAAVHSVQMTGSLTEDMRGVTAVAGQPAVTMNFSGDFSGLLQMKPLAGRITLSHLRTGNGGLPGSMVELLTPDAIYLHIAALQARTGKQWAVLRFAEMANATGIDLRQLLAQAQQMKPNQVLDQLLKSGNVRRVGAETIRGVATTHYAGTVPVSASVAQFSGSTRTQMANVMRSTGLRTTAIDVWIDARGLVRRARTSAAGPKATIAMTLEVVAYDVPVDVTPPPVAQTVDLATLH